MKTIFRKLYGGEAGLGLAEALVGLAILGLVAIAVLSGLTTGAKASIIHDEQAKAESLARSVVEFIKSDGCPFVPSATQYTLPNELKNWPGGWSIANPTVQPVPDTGTDNGKTIQKVTVTVKHNTKTILSLVTFKADR